MQAQDLKRGMPFHESRDSDKTKAGYVLSDIPQKFDEKRLVITASAIPAVSLCKTKSDHLHIRTSRGDWCIHREHQLYSLAEWESMKDEENAAILAMQNGLAAVAVARAAGYAALIHAASV